MLRASATCARLSGLRIGVVLSGALIAAFLLLQLAISIQDQKLPLKAGGRSFAGNSSLGEDVFLLGAGKADITGSAYSQTLTLYC